ncbi:MAG: VTT domain-containing protein [Rhodothalassiaceae bacterium]
MLLFVDLNSFVTLLEQLAADPWLLFFVLMGMTLISEDIAIVGGALMVAEGVSPLWWSFFGINAGIILGDGVLYGVGAFAARYRRARALVASRRVYRLKRFIRGRLAVILLSTRFVPGSRVPTYTACGFFGFSFSYFFAVLASASLIWTGIVFTVVVTTGAMILETLGPWKWVGALMFILLAIFLPRLTGKRLAQRLGVIGSAAKSEKPAP